MTLQQNPIYEIDLTWDYLKDNPNDIGPGLTATDFRTLVGFFNARHGSFDNFLWQDPLDNQVTNCSLVSATNNNLAVKGDGSTRVFQLARQVGSSFEAVQNPAGTQLGTPVAQIFVGGVLQTPVTNYTLGPNGVVTFVAAPALNAVLTASFNFYHRVHFLNDQQEIENFMYQLWTLKTITLESDPQ